MPKVSDAYRQHQRRRILDAAATCFAAKGFQRTSMADIVSVSGLSPGAIYGYFDGKAEIVAAIAQERHAHEAELFTVAMAHDDLREGLSELFRSYVEWLKDPKERERRLLAIQVWAEAPFDEKLAATMSRGVPQRAQLRTALESARRRGVVPKAVDPESLSRLILAVLQGFILQQASDPDIDADAYASTAQALINSLLAGG
jgi:AcrR family transcriptional regulator